MYRLSSLCIMQTTCWCFAILKLLYTTQFLKSNRNDCRQQTEKNKMKNKMRTKNMHRDRIE